MATQVKTPKTSGSSGVNNSIGTAPISLTAIVDIATVTKTLTPNASIVFITFLEIDFSASEPSNANKIIDNPPINMYSNIANVIIVNIYIYAKNKITIIK